MRDKLQRRLAIAAAILFLVSCAFPVVAAFVKDTQSWPRWWGRLDVGLAFVLVVMAFLLLSVARRSVNQQTRDICYRAYRILIHGIFVMLVIFFLLGERIIWSQCLTGLSWRAWLLLYVLPEWLAAFRATATLTTRL